ncbi:MAG: hypothetical protein PHX45_13435 [Acidobacteriota bacterium]|nr:hypothetical protein [Acidobacteriota bacterium]
MKQTSLLARIRKYLTEPPVSQGIFEISSRYVCGIHLAPKEKKIRASIIRPLPEGAVVPSFDKKNIQDLPHLENVFKEVLGKLGLNDGPAACLIPEPCVKILILPDSNEHIPERDREKLIRWRVGKQMPLLPEDTRFSYQLLGSPKTPRIAVAAGRASVVGEYEGLLARFGLKPGRIGVPSLSLLNFLSGGEDEDYMVINIEDGFVSLLAVTDSSLSLYRQKSLAGETGPSSAASPRMDGVVHEVENTIRFIEDREKRKIRSLWIRQGSLEKEEDLAGRLARTGGLSARDVGSLVSGEAPAAEKTFLAPLMGEIP